MELAFTGSTFNTGQALNKHLVDRVIIGHDVIDVAEKLVDIACVNYHKYNKQKYLDLLDDALCNLNNTQ